MRSIGLLICSIIQLFFGILGIIAFVILAVSGENMIKWIMALILAIAFVIMGVIEIIYYVKQK